MHRLIRMGQIEFRLLIALAAICVALSLATDTFLTLGNLTSLLNNNSVNLSCAEGAWVPGATTGTAGCCSTNAGSLAEQVRLNPECSFLGTGNESGTISIHVCSSGGISCTPYTLSYGDS